MQKIKQLNTRLDAMEDSHTSVHTVAKLSKHEAQTVGLNSEAQYIKISNPDTGATFYYPDNGRLQSAAN